MKRNRAWLRSIVNLGARAPQEHIRPEVISLQEDTVLAALGILEREAGVLLADEVGMGKTFQTLGIIACTLEHDKHARVLVVTPTPELNEQWYWSSQRFAEHGFYRFAPRTFAMVDHLRDLPARARKHSVVFAPLSIFVGTREREERGFLLSLWATQRRLSSRKLAAIRERIAQAGVSVAPGREFLGHSAREIAKKPLQRAFRRSPEEGQGFRGLDELLEEGLEAFSAATAVRRALDRAHFHVLRALVPTFRLLVVDEAHKLKDPWTVRAQAVTHVLRKNYEKAVFLTATPFQLGIEELRHVFQLFFNARTVPDGFADDVERLFGSVRSYQRAYARFEAQWRYVDETQARALSDWYGSASRSNAPAFERLDDNVRLVAEQIWQLIKLKQEQVEPAFRQWMLRSLKPGKHARRKVDLWRIEPQGEAVVPFVLYERLLEEARRRTRGDDQALADANIQSSYAAAKSGRLLRERSRDSAVRAYQDVVRRAIQGQKQPHPKIAHTARDVLQAAAAGEKTLIFCERTATIKALQKEIDRAWMQRQLEVWNQVCPGYSFDEIFGSGRGREHVRGVAEKVPPRFFRGSDELSVAFSDSLTYALFLQPGEDELPREFWQASGSVLDRANRLLAASRLPAPLAARLDYPLAQRCIEQAAAQWFKKHAPKRVSAESELLAAVLDPRYIRFGFAERETKAEKSALEAPGWSISRPVFDAVLAPRRPGIWAAHRAALAPFPPAIRGLIVQAVRYFLTRREVPFLAELMQRVGSPQASSAQLREAIERWWEHEACGWRERVSELLAYLPCLTRAEQREVLSDMLRSPRIVQNSLASQARIARQNSFNAPFYPMVLVGNQAFQQGLDLHRQCRRIIHFDLRWNPTDLEQRIGRIERHGCLAERFEPDDPQGKVHVIYALLERTSDAQLYRSVKIREKWMDFLLGQPPEVGEQGARAVPSLPLPQQLVEDLRIELGPATS